MKKIAFLGLGAMGSRMAANLIKAGHKVNVWNRTKDKAAPLVEIGASLAMTPKMAVQDAEVVFSMVRDDKASADVWLDPIVGALAALNKDAVAIECSTLSTSFISKLTAAFQDADKKLLDAPLAGSRPQAEAGQLIFFVGGKSDPLDEVRPLLNVLGGQVHHCGEAGSGVVVKLMVNALFGVQLATIAELIAFAKNSGIDESMACEILGATPVCSMAVKVSSMAMLEGKFQPAFPIELVRKDFGLVETSAEAAKVDLPMSMAAKKIYQKGCDSGFSEDNITGIIQLYS